MTRPTHQIFIAIAMSTAFTCVDAVAAATPEVMMAQCRSRAAKAFRARLPDVETKYEGQRTDGTHAINGTAIFRGQTKTFQCSFDRAGQRIVRFIVNR